MTRPEGTSDPIAPSASPRVAHGPTIPQGDRAKAYRPISAAERAAALDGALAAWQRDDWFETHELLEPAWMGAADGAERDLYQGLIKLAAAYVHRARGNATGMAKNLAGARLRLERAATVGDVIAGVAVAPVLAEVSRRLPAPGTPADLMLPPPPLPAHSDGVPPVRQSGAAAPAEESR